MSSDVAAYPVRVEGSLDPQLSRWLWLVKWLLVIPHYIVLAFLWLAFFVLSVIALFAILFTGRYPRALFDFNVGVLRWSWRVAFYAFSANGTDRYPPFTLAEADYPATFGVEYPAHLSRGLVLVKWWLLALPHYLVVALFAGGAWFSAGHFGLIGLLVLFAVVALLFTGRYPRGIFDFVLGMNRWALRVAAYSALMTDRYPPFRMDMGGSDQLAFELPAEAGPLGDGGRVAAIAGGAVMTLLAVALLGGSGGLLAFERTQRDAAGFVMTGGHAVSTATYALVSQRVQPPPFGDTVQIRARAARPVFVAIGPAAAVERYLAGTAHEQVNNLTARRGTTSAGGPPAAAAQDQRFWLATGARAVRWRVRDGAWRAVVMNADGSPGVSAVVRVGIRFGHPVRLTLAGMGAGLVLLSGGVALLYVGLRRRASAIASTA
jgi:hypothetical protein